MTVTTVDAAGLLAGHDHGPAPILGRDLIALAQEAGLTGRGGGGFPTWRKLAAVATAAGRPIVIGNGAEGEPGSDKDRTLLTRSPHLVLDGLRLVAAAVGASQLYLYVPADLAGRLRPLAPDVTVVDAPDAFIAGEESAVVSRVEGGAALPRDKRKRVVEHGVKGAPTLVQNVETLAHLALLARYGPRWFRRRGTPEEPGTFLATLSGAVRQPGVYEAPYGIPLAELVAMAGGPSQSLQAVLIGGYHGAWLPARPEVPVSRAGLRPYGASPGAGVVIALPTDACGLVESGRIASYLARQTAGQCGPCVNGLPRLADTLTRLARRERHAGLPAEVERLIGLVTGRGACHHPDGTARFVRSALQTFAPEVRAHLAGTCVTEGGHRG
ncbi:NADH-ubiquinone oxidoreductase-F iron-sulfur binding region domain-containing protein [Phytohabitans rumicis]|uniref:NADH dehydrogenase n=1 Tax=Phytohabitans rumicis TaxID=1076125 RepID=A0A6V8L6Z9_9ACTN|nr:NADH-ubiquinone oxidoreductase-F iron-sulfur binding region domain-containing protein [Phytohabitans rumicis]GFJ90419.1 NADH dehydrogenase [Phytohabitans rumicis]